MAISVVMPALEMAQDTGKLISWRKMEGESVSKGEILLEVETDKAVVEIEALADGILGGVKAQPGDVIPVGHTIAWLLTPGEAVPLPSPQLNISAPPSHGLPEGKPEVASRTSTESRNARLSPKARRLAKEHDMDLSLVRGSGPGGEILAADILDAVRSRDLAVPVPSAGDPTN